MCGADIEKIEEDENIQSLVDRFIEGHARIKRTQEVDNNAEENKEEAVAESLKNKTVIYEDVSLERGAFLFQHAVRVSFYCITAVLLEVLLFLSQFWHRNLSFSHLYFAFASFCLYSGVAIFLMLCL